MAHDPAESRRSRGEGRRRPPQGQRSAVPVLHPTPPSAGRHAAVGDQVRRSQATPQRAGQTQMIDNEHLFKLFAKRRRRAGVGPLQPDGVRLALGHPRHRGERERRLEHGTVGTSVVASGRGTQDTPGYGILERRSRHRSFNLPPRREPHPSGQPFLTAPRPFSSCQRGVTSGVSLPAGGSRSVGWRGRSWKRPANEASPTPDAAPRPTPRAPWGSPPGPRLPLRSRPGARWGSGISAHRVGEVGESVPARNHPARACTLLLTAD
jgi:hypothetical protein